MSRRKLVATPQEAAEIATLDLYSPSSEVLDKITSIPPCINPKPGKHPELHSIWPTAASSGVKFSSLMTLVRPSLNSVVHSFLVAS